MGRRLLHGRPRGKYANLIVLLTLSFFFVLHESPGFGDPYFDGSVPSYSWEKNLFDNSEYTQGYPPNILFLIDTSGSMLQDKTGGWTDGDGGRPWKRGGDKQDWEYYWGYDTDTSNNDVSIESNYHPLLVYKGEDEYLYVNSRENPPYNHLLVPNDSRLYILRNVLYRLSLKKDLMSGINIALATYAQDYRPLGVYTGSGKHWYAYEKYKAVEKCERRRIERRWQWVCWYENQWVEENPLIKWEGGSTVNENMRGMGAPRIALGSAIDSDTGEMRQDYMALVDGVEANGELRADGATPLAASIYNETTPSSAYDFFTDLSGEYDGYCQSNWVIVMTDGADSYYRNPRYPTAPSPAWAVKNLYDNTKNLQDKDGKKLEYPVRTMVIGFINSADNPVLRDDLDLCADVGFDGIQNGKPAHAYYADNFDDLFAAFEDILTTIKEMSGSGGTPSMRPGIPGSEGFVYVPGREYHENALWTGTLKKYDINFLGELGDETIWEASSKIIPATRTVLAANWHGGGSNFPGTNLKAFTSANWRSVLDEMGLRYALSGNSMIPDDDPRIEAQTKCFIRWYRGENPATVSEPCPNWGTRKSPLADMERSGLLVVGPPRAMWGDEKYIQFREDNNGREECVYIQSSEGMLHCFAADTGEELWAFVPPQALRWARIAALRAERLMDEGEPSFWKWSWYGDDPQKTGNAVPREILGGPLVVEDVLLGTGSNARYGTVLLGCLGYGGYGMYALEITDPEKPNFLWAVENAAAVEPVIGQDNPFLPDDREKYPVQALLHWAEDKESSSTARLRYCSTVNGVFDEDAKYSASEDALPCADTYLTERRIDGYVDLAFTLSTPFVGRLRLASGETPQSVGFIGGGLRERLETGSTTRGSVLYIFSLEDGRIYGAWGKGISTEYSPSDRYFGENVPTMGMIYAPLSPMISSGGDTVRRIYAPDSNGYIHCVKFFNDASGEELLMRDWEHEIPVYLADTAPVAIPYQMPVGTIGSAVWLFGGTRNVITPSGTLTNTNQYIFGIKVSAFCEGTGCGADCTDEPIVMENLKPLDLEEGEDALVIDSSPCGYEEDGTKKYWGWKIVLTNDEYVSASPVLSDMFGRLFAATFLPDDTQDRCVAESGKAKLFILDAQNGASDWLSGTEEKYVAFDNVRITGISVYDSFRTGDDGEQEPGTRVILTFQEGSDGGENLEDGLTAAGAKDVAVGDEVASFFIGLTDARKGALGVIHFDQTSLRFWKNSE